MSAFAIPWGLIPREQIIPIAWALAACAASVPAAFASILWVQAWRGVPRFGPPRCRHCRTALRGEGHTVPDRCPECGTATAGVDVDFGTRRWSWWPALRTLAIGGVLVAIAVTYAALSNAHVHRQVRFAGITSYTAALDPTMRSGRIGPAVLGALRFASDAAPSDDEVRAATVPALLAFARGEIPADRGLGLLFDGSGSPDAGTHRARMIAVDLVGSLVTRGALTVAQGRTIIARIADGPRLVIPLRQPSGSRLWITVDPGLWYASGTLHAVRIAREDEVAQDVPLEELSAEDAGWLDGNAAPRPRSFASALRLERGRYAIEVDWTGTIVPPTDADELQRPWWSERRTDRLVVEVVDIDESPWHPVPLAAVGDSPFVAAAQQPFITRESIGAVRSLTVRMSAPLRPGVAMSGRWILIAQGHELPFETTVWAIKTLELDRSVLLPSDVSPRLERVDCIFEPDPMLATEFRPHASGVWPTRLVFRDVPVSLPLTAQ